MADELLALRDTPAFTAYERLGAGYALLWKQAQAGLRGHAFLLAGPRGVGKASFARALAAIPFCESDAKPCWHCAGCGRVKAGSEPDVVEIYSREDKAIPIERIREAVAQVSRHSFGGGPRVLVVEPVEKLTPAAQNCLLKSLEEPQANVVFFLLTHEPSAVLGTIASRCAMVKLPPWPDGELQTALLALGIDAARVQAVLPRAGGNIGQALAALADDAGESEYGALANQMLSAQSDAQAVALSTRLKDDRAAAERTLAALEQTLHSALLARTGLLPGNTLGPTAAAYARSANEAQLAELLHAVADVRKWRQSQVNWQASIDRLLITIVEAKTKWQPL